MRGRLRLWLPAMIAMGLFPGGASANEECRPGGLFCFPSETVVRGYLAERYPHLRVGDLRYRSRPFGQPDDVSQRFRVEFVGTATLLADLYRDIPATEIAKACGAKPEAAPTSGRSVYRVSTPKDAVIRIEGDAAMRGESGRWVGGADMLNMASEAGDGLFGNTAEALGPDAVILGLPTGDSFCAALREGSPPG
jgi:hypothetical protein